MGCNLRVMTSLQKTWSPTNKLQNLKLKQLDFLHKTSDCNAKTLPPQQPTSHGHLSLSESLDNYSIPRKFKRKYFSNFQGTY